MIQGRNVEAEELLNQAFEHGYSNATSSFSRLLKQKVGYSNLYGSTLRMNGKASLQIGDLNREGPHALLTTEIFGDVTGKSYLLLTPTEVDFIASRVSVPQDMWTELKVEFIKEVDNILSAAVITRLSDRLNLCLYGDIPILTEHREGTIEDVIFKDFAGLSEEIHVSASCFSFESQADIRPVFIWVVDGGIMKTLPG